MVLKIEVSRRNRHLGIAVVSTCVVGLIALLRGPEYYLDSVSVVTAYLSVALLVAVFSIGPQHAQETGKGILNSHARRDLGIWAALLGLIHFIAGTEQSMTALYIGTFAPDGFLRQTFSWGSITGLIVAIVLLLLLLLSNDRSLRWLGAKWWKRLQRTGYLALALTFYHGFAFQYLEGRSWWWVVLLGLAAVAILVFQGRGIAAVRRARRLD